MHFWIWKSCGRYGVENSGKSYKEFYESVNACVQVGREINKYCGLIQCCLTSTRLFNSFPNNMAENKNKTAGNLGDGEIIRDKGRREIIDNKIVVVTRWCSVNCRME